MPALARLFLAAALLVVAQLPVTAMSQEAASPAAVAWRLLDYIAVDYPGAVSGGRIVSDAEYAEMREFSASVRSRIDALPAGPAKSQLLAESTALVAAVDRRAEPKTVALQARSLGSDLLKAYPVPLAPRQAPDLARGAALYTEQCAACHGASGRGDGPNAKDLNPRPVAFTDVARAKERSLFGLYQVIGQGLDGTAMPSFAHLSSDDRWALAFHVGSFAYPQGDARAGGELWRNRPELRADVADLQALVQTTPAAFASRVGEPQASQLVAYLRRNPDVIATKSAGGLDVARRKLAESLTAYQAGDRKRAEELALSAYLDGFEPVEPMLRARDGGLMAKVEAGMGQLRASISRGAPATEVATQVRTLETLFDQAAKALAPDQTSAASTFLGAFTILLREGVEALLIVIAMIAFLRKAERHDVLPYVHAGWASALAGGGLTWAAATYLISISGASRELTEGVGSLVSAVVLISVGVWMHGKAQAGAWQAYIRDKLSAALSKRSAWFLFLLAFIVVYREVFETILFYAALWSQGGQVAMVSGAALAVACLGVIAWALLSYSKRLPIAQFFSYSSLLIATLAVVLAGKGVAGLQEAGWLDVRPLPALPRIEVLGIFPTWEGLVAQLVTLTVVVIGFWTAGRRAEGQANA
ncbi:high-affinity iron transporter [Phenylobacterium haematophilum]|jgi:high-affinity iron transporter|uniref:High-affinity iron transporter n=1 Tax=Phenylobacterium haematophilum TaxID=98513 RepID=A0A840A3L4_9CAUL|nr:cytochrome c/FTR1 family iron permease [Phenylobacterium haematophilum]MBB3892904.1 high-affinity iron transporter [Phenylobacterium haematophilum]